MSEEVKEKKVKKQKSKTRKIIEWVITGVFAALFVFLGAASIDGLVHKKDNCGQTLRFGIGTFVVKTDSMEPKYKVGSALITYKESPEQIIKDFDAGKIIDISFMDNKRVSGQKPVGKSAVGENYDPDGTSPTGFVMTHRLREYKVLDNVKKGEGKYIFFTAGINVGGHMSGAGQWQSFTEKELLGVVKVGSNFLGGLFSFITSPIGLIVLLLIPAGYLIVTSTLDIFKTMKEPEEVEAGGASGSSNGGGSAGGSSLEGMSEADKERLKQELLQEMMDKKGK